jgi:TRAP-type transport system periplasmic protein
MKRRKYLITAVVTAGLLAAAWTMPALADTRLRIAGQHPMDHYGTAALEQIKSDLESAGVGFDVKLFPAGQLGNGEQVFDDVAKGVIDIGHTFVYSHNDPKLEINSVPYLVSNYAEMKKVFLPGSVFYRTFEDLLDKQEIKLLGIFVEGFIGVATAKEPDNATTLGPKGVNIRVWSAEAARSAAVDMGFNTTTMSWGDVVPAIQQGTVDGVIGGTAESYHAIMRDVIKYYIPYNAFVENTAYYMSKKTWAKLDDAQRQAVVAAFQKASADSFAMTEELDRLYTQKLAEDGIKVIALSDADRAVVAAAVRNSTWPLLEEKLGKELLDQLKADLN